jgi:hypothetical protein
MTFLDGWACAAEIVRLLAEKRSSAVEVPGASLLPADAEKEAAESEAIVGDATTEEAAEPEATAVSPTL